MSPEPTAEPTPGKKNLTEFKADIYAGIPQVELVVFAVQILRNDEIPATVEEIVSFCFRLFPKSFSLKNYFYWPDSALVSRRLQDAREKGYLKGMAAEGFELKGKGKPVARRVAKSLGVELPKPKKVEPLPPVTIAADPVKVETPPLKVEPAEITPPSLEAKKPVAPKKKAIRKKPAKQTVAPVKKTVPKAKPSPVRQKAAPVTKKQVKPVTKPEPKAKPDVKVAAPVKQKAAPVTKKQVKPVAKPKPKTKQGVKIVAPVKKVAAPPKKDSTGKKRPGSGKKVAKTPSETPQAKPAQLTLGFAAPPSAKKKPEAPAGKPKVKKEEPVKVQAAPPAVHVSKEEKDKAGKIVKLMERSDAYQQYKKNGGKARISEFDFRNMLYATMESSAETLKRNVDLFKRYAGIHNRTDLITFLSFCEESFAALLNAKQPARRLKI